MWLSLRSIFEAKFAPWKQERAKLKVALKGEASHSFVQSSFFIDFAMQASFRVSEVGQYDGRALSTLVESIFAPHLLRRDWQRAFGSRGTDGGEVILLFGLIFSYLDLAS